MPVNPLTAPLDAFKKLGEQASMGIQQLGTGLTNITSQGIDALAMAAPALPGLPGAAPGAAPAALPGLPGLPANLQQVLTQVENVVVPAGLPRPSAILTGKAAAAPAAPTPEAANQQVKPARPARLPSIDAQ